MKHLKNGHQCSGRYVSNWFNEISVPNMAYCKSHNFVYDPELEEVKLYNGLPCFYTDNRYRNSMLNFYGDCKIYMNRRMYLSLKGCIRRTMKLKGLPKGSIVKFTKGYYHPGTHVDNSYHFKVKSSKPVDVEYEINSPGYSANFNTCDFSKQLTDVLRSNGFIVNVESKNPNFLSGMIAMASAFKGNPIEVDNEGGESAVAYGHGMKIGYSSNRESLYGYHSGCDNVLFAYFGHFNKWSQCRELSKDLSVDEIVASLLEPREID